MTSAPDPVTPAQRRRSTTVASIVLAVALCLVAAGLHRASSREDRGTSAAAGADVVQAPAEGREGSTSGAQTTSTSPAADASASVPAAFAGAPWYPRFASDVAYANTWLGVFRPVGYTKYRDGGVQDMNIEDGHRRSWSPPACTCPKMSLWIYGSTAVLGLGQRDDFTMASMLSKVAWSHGISLEVVNKGVPGDQFWLQADRFAWDVSGSEPPDMVLFYAGVSDLNAALSLNERRLGDRDWPDDLLADAFMQDPVVQGIVDEELRGGKERPPAPEGVHLVTPEPAPELDPAGVGELATSRLGEQLPMGLDVADRYGVTPFVFWEPMRLSRKVIEGEPVTPDDPELKTTIAAAVASLPRGVIDLSHALDGEDTPLFFDDIHHNELGANLAAEAIYEHLLPTITALAAERGG